MKTAISLPDDLFRRADQLARQMGVSRSELYATAVAEYLAKHRQTDVTELLDKVYGPEAAGLDETVKLAQLRSALLG